VHGPGFAAAFADGRRMPGYPLLLAAFVATCEQPWWAARLAQTALASLVVVLAAALVWRVGRDLGASLGAAILVAAWPPSTMFAPVLIAESVSAVLVACLLLVLLPPAPGRIGLGGAALAAAVCLALVAVKPNHALLLPLVALWLAAAAPPRAPPRVLRPALFLGVVALGVAPWAAFVSRAQERFVPLTTTLGENLLLGTGCAALAADGSARGTVFAAAAERLGLADPDLAAAERPAGDRAAAASAELAAQAAARWRERPGALSLYGLSKVVHAFGGSRRGIGDWASLLLSVASLAAAVTLWRRRQHRRVVVLLAALGSLVAAQAFVFLPDQRFRVVAFDSLAACTLALWFAGRRAAQSDGAVLDAVQSGS
jgi:hypothetical protein